MKNTAKYLMSFLLILSLFGNGLLLYYIKETEKPHSSISKLTLGINNTVIYCENSEGVRDFLVDMQENSFQFGEAKLISGDNLYLQTPKNKINLSDYEAQGFVINSSGELLYSLVVPTLKKQKVFVTPNGKRYHTDAYCAGRTGFEIDCETAMFFDREPCRICAE